MITETHLVAAEYEFSRLFLTSNRIQQGVLEVLQDPIEDKVVMASAAGRLPSLVNLVARPLVPSNRKAEPLDRNSALPFTSGFEPTVAILPPFHPS